MIFAIAYSLPTTKNINWDTLTSSDDIQQRIKTYNKISTDGLTGFASTEFIKNKKPAVPSFGEEYPKKKPAKTPGTLKL